LINLPHPKYPFKNTHPTVLSMTPHHLMAYGLSAFLVPLLPKTP
jgi:hypothetical protein